MRWKRWKVGLVKKQIEKVKTKIEDTRMIMQWEPYLAAVFTAPQFYPDM